MNSPVCNHISRVYTAGQFVAIQQEKARSQHALSKGEPAWLFLEQPPTVVQGVPCTWVPGKKDKG